MRKHMLRAGPAMIALLACTVAGFAQAPIVLRGRASGPVAAPNRAEAYRRVMQRLSHRVTPQMRKEAAESLRANRGAVAGSITTNAGGTTANMAMPMPGGTPNYFGPEPNWAWSPPIQKFVDTLPAIPIAVADTATYPGSDYYEIGLVEYQQTFHRDLKPTTLRGYVQLNDPLHPINRDSTGKPITWPQPNYLGPLVLAHKNVPVRIKFYNLLPTGAGGDLFLPVDTSEMGAGMGPLMMGTTPGYPMNYTENRATLHLHGGKTPWISDGTPHQWITPAGELTDYPKGVSVQNVPDMPTPGDGSMTFFYSNQQSARLMFYHDHAYGITRLNVYAGEAAGYLLTDDIEADLIKRGVLPNLGTPLVIQDKTFVDTTIDPMTGMAKTLTSDPTWPFAINAAENDLWYPHVYMPNQNPNDMSGANPVGRWDYGPWFWPPWPVDNPPIQVPDGSLGFGFDGVPDELPNLPNLSMTMEAFHDTPLVNGKAYPVMNVDPKTYRFRILNAANDRMWNLQLYVADPAASTEVRMVPAAENGVYPAGLLDMNGNPIAVGTPIPFPAPWKAKTTGQPGDILDGRTGGVPDPILIGPKIIQIGTEGGFLPTPVVFDNIPIGYNRNPKDITVGNIFEHNLFLGPAERADVLIDFSAYQGKTIILYNDAPAAVPAADSRLDYFTGDLNQTDTGGNVSTQPGYGPNTRTIMQIVVSNATPAAPYDLARLQDEFSTTALHDSVFKRGQDPIIVPQAAYNSAYGATFANVFSKIQSTTLTFTPIGGTGPVTFPLEAKAIHELFENAWGRMNALLGLEMKFTNGLNQTTLPFGYIDPITEFLNDAVTTANPVTLNDGTQIWKITHNGVDTHPIHFHLFDVQLINRVGWDGAIKPPEPNELGWKETVRMNPLEDCIVALRPVAPKIPFGVPDSVRPLDPTMPLGSTAGFAAWKPDGTPATTTNYVENFGWEYVWHCHILSHEEMDMMRPVKFNVARALPDASVLTGFATGNLTWTDPTPPSLSTTWGNPSNEIGYRIERAPTGSNTFTPIATVLANGTAYLDMTASANNFYDYRVVAWNAAGETQSNVVTIGPPIPADPTGLAAIAVSPNQVNLSWTALASTQTGFRIERAVGGGAFFAIGTALATATSWPDTTAADGATISYRLFAYNPAGDSLNPSNTATVTTPPNAPTGLTATFAGPPLSVNLAWTDAATVETGFNIERAPVVAGVIGAFAPIGTVGAGVTVYSDAKVSAGATYAYRVFAVSGTVVSLTAAGPATITTPTIPTAPSNLRATPSANGVAPITVALAWGDNSTNETAFFIERKNGIGGFVPLTSVPANTTRYTDTGVLAGSVYTYRIYAANAAGSSTYATSTQITTGPSTPPAAPSNLRITATSNTSLSLGWTDLSPNETGFQIQRSTTSNGPWTTVVTTAANATAYKDNGLTRRTTYYYQIRSINGFGWSAWTPVTPLAGRTN